MTKRTLAEAIIRVIFPRSLALLSADATGDLLTFAIMLMYRSIMRRHGRNIFMVTWKIPKNKRNSEPFK